MARVRYGLLIAGAAELGFLWILARQDVATAFPGVGLALFAGAFLSYVIAAWLVASRGTEESGPGVPMLWIWGVGVALRAALFTIDPALSDDFYRYLWDGHVQSAGVNPYLHAPASAALEPIRTTWHGLINNPSVPTIYPPLAQMVFLLVAAVGSKVWMLKAIWLVCDLGTAALVVRIATETGRRPAPVLLLYLWAPLLVVEVAWSAHLEPLGILAMMAAVLATSGERASTVVARAGAGAALALATLTKFAPAASLPALVRRSGWVPLLGFTATIALLYLPYVSVGPSLFAGLATYGEHWWFMQGAFTGLEVLAGDPVRARQLAGVLVVGVVGGTIVKKVDLETALFWTLGAGMILTPTFHPWYVLWMLPLAALRQNRAWLLLCGLTFLGYFGVSSYQTGGDWLQPGWLRTALWLPFFILLLHDFVRPGHRAPGTDLLSNGGDAERGVP